MKQYKAAFSVEAAWVFGITMLIIYAVIAFSFVLYRDSYQFVKQTTPDKWEAVKMFRLAQTGEDIIMEIQK